MTLPDGWVEYSCPCLWCEKPVVFVWRPDVEVYTLDKLHETCRQEFFKTMIGMARKEYFKS